MKLNSIYNMDCLEGMKSIPENSVDMILTDLPYGVTECEWDNIIPFAPLWEQYNRIAKENAAIVLFAVQPFTTKLIHSNLKNFRYCWYWKKNNVTGAPFAKVQPMRCIEDICVFYKKKPTYNPQGLKKLEKPKIREKDKADKERVYKIRTTKQHVQKYTNYPVHLLQFSNEAVSNKNRLHPTQKPLALCEYLIKTYTNENDVVFDSCAGSGTTLVAAKKNGRQYIGFESAEKYYNTAVERLFNCCK
jgi:site-specific DNA-methyltransferase (adenine-specific)